MSNDRNCKNTEYVCYILNSEIQLSPTIWVYNSNQSRKDSNKTTVLNHVLKYHFPRIVISEVDGKYIVDTSKLIEGLYRYKFSVGKKKRKWIREA